MIHQNTSGVRCTYCDADLTRRNRVGVLPPRTPNMREHIEAIAELIRTADGEDAIALEDACAALTEAVSLHRYVLIWPALSHQRSQYACGRDRALDEALKSLRGGV